MQQNIFNTIVRLAAVFFLGANLNYCAKRWQDFHRLHWWFLVYLKSHGRPIITFTIYHDTIICTSIIPFNQGYEKFTDQLAEYHKMGDMAQRQGIYLPLCDCYNWLWFVFVPPSAAAGFTWFTTSSCTGDSCYLHLIFFFVHSHWHVRLSASNTCKII